MQPPDCFDENEEQRLAALHAYDILDTPDEHAFEVMTYLTARLCKTKIALISLVDRDRQWFKSAFGLSIRETSRDVSFCAHAIVGEDIFVVENALMDPRFRDNPLVTGEPYIRFYAGIPIRSQTGHRLGTLCIIDDQPRCLSDKDREILQTMGRQLEHQLNFRVTFLKDFQDLFALLLHKTQKQP